MLGIKVFEVQEEALSTIPSEGLRRGLWTSGQGELRNVDLVRDGCGD